MYSRCVDIDLFSLALSVWSCEVIDSDILNFLPERPHFWRACVSVISIANGSITRFPSLLTERLAIERATCSASGGLLEFATDRPGVK